MQVKFFSIPIIGGEAESEAMNLFLRSEKILQTENQLVNGSTGAYWCFCVKYLQGSGSISKDRDRARIDYMQVLDAETFKRFSKMRETRKRLAGEEAIPAYAVFTDEELAEMARPEILTAPFMKSVKGIGEKKFEKYSAHFLNATL